MLVCYPSCKKNKNLLISSIESFQRHNPKITFAIFNNNEFSKSDLKDIKKHCQKLLVFDISFWMDIFKDCQAMYFQHNAYIRFLMPRVFQKFNKRVSQIIYCDEDCYCIGSINKFWRYPFKSDILGVVDPSDLRIGRNDVLRVPRIKNERFVGINRKNYINSGLLKMKTRFDIREALKAINMNIILFCAGIDMLHDQTIVNELSHDIIFLRVPKSSNLKHIISRLSKIMLENFGLCHTYFFKNNLKAINRELSKQRLQRINTT